MDSDWPADKLEHPAIVSARQTCEAVPDQWSGTLANGLSFYFRYRFGWASLACGPDAASVEGVCRGEDLISDWAAGVEVTRVAHGDRLRGAFDSDQERSDVFRRLFELQVDR